MIKPKLKWFTKSLPTIQLNKSLFAPRIILGGLSFTQKRIHKGRVFSKLLIIALPLSIYLYFGPQTAVLADWEEKVIPAKIEVAPPITYGITAEKAPSFGFPVQIDYISTYFSRYHQGIDLPNSYQNPVNSIADGEVVFAGASSLGYGNMVVVRHQLGYESLYAHLASVNVKVGDQVTVSDVLGLVGSTGVASGNHLHLEVHLNGAAINPLSILGK